MKKKREIKLKIPIGRAHSPSHWHTKRYANENVQNQIGHANGSEHYFWICIDHGNHFSFFCVSSKPKPEMKLIAKLSEKKIWTNNRCHNAFVIFWMECVGVHEVGSQGIYNYSLIKKGSLLLWCRSAATHNPHRNCRFCIRCPCSSFIVESVTPSIAK